MNRTMGNNHGGMKEPKAIMRAILVHFKNKIFSDEN